MSSPAKITVMANMHTNRAMPARRVGWVEPGEKESAVGTGSVLLCRRRIRKVSKNTGSQKEQKDSKPARGITLLFKKLKQ